MKTRLASLLDYYLALRDLTPYKLAQLCGHSEATISRIRSGRTTRGSLQTLKDIGQALDIPLIEMLEASGRRDMAENYRLAAQTRSVPTVVTPPSPPGRPNSAQIAGVDDVDPLAYTIHPGRSREFLLLSQQLSVDARQISQGLMDDTKFLQLPEPAQEIIIRLLRGAVYSMQTLLIAGSFLLHFRRNGHSAI